MTVFGLALFAALMVLTTQDSAAQDNSANRLTIGQRHGGGIIFRISDDGLHGLIAADHDQSVKGIAWNPGKPVKTDALGNALYAGITNTNQIIKIQGSGTNSAALLCDEFVSMVNGIAYDDWYLPSLYELQLLYEHRHAIGGFNLINGIYWSSTETTSEPEFRAWEIEFKFGTKLEDDKDLPNQVRCVRRF